jgi:CheY-like chemotaxis protein
MGLECLILSCDPVLIGHFEESFSKNEYSLQLRQDSASAVELGSRRHLDGFVIDCDDVRGGKDALVQIRKSRANQQTPVLAVLNGSTSAGAAIDLGANFVLSKPIHPTRLRSVFYVAVSKMEREHRRYFRYEAELPVRLRNPAGQFIVASMKNVSEGGLAIKLADPIKLKGVVIFEFELPSVEPQTFHAKAEVVWSDSFVVGLRFLYVNKESVTALQEWLTSLEARARFHKPPGVL